jgi:hypothetical protein
VAGEVGKSAAAIGGQGSDEASELLWISKMSTVHDEKGASYGARWDVVKLGCGNGGQGNDGCDGKGLHGDGVVVCSVEESAERMSLFVNDGGC